MARRAQVSISTASLVINNKGGVSDELRKRVWEAVEALGFRPNAIARGLKTKESLVLGLIIPDIANPFFPLIVRGVEDAAAAHGYTVILGNTDGEVLKEQQYLDHFVERRVDGLILIPASNCEEMLSFYQELELPKVIIDRPIEGLDVPIVMTDNVRGAYMATNHLLNRGRRRILFISGPRDLGASVDRRVGYLQALREFGITDEWIRYGEFSFQSGREIASTAYTNLSFDGLFCANDLIALGAIQSLIARGVKIPQQVEVVGYDNIFFAEFSSPSLTTIEQPAYKMGTEAVKVILDGIRNSSSAEMSVKLLEPRLIIRSSSPEKDAKHDI